MRRNMTPIVYGVLAIFAVALGLFVANVFGNPVESPVGPANGVASASAKPTATLVAPTAAPAATIAKPTAAPAAPTAAPAATITKPTVAPAAPTEPVAATAVAIATPGPTVEPTAAPPAEPAFIEYTVQRGDSLKSIAQRYNTTVTALLEANDLRNPDSLTVGNVIKVPRT